MGVVSSHSEKTPFLVMELYTVVILLVTLYWESGDGLASHPGGSSNTPSLLYAEYPMLD